MSVLVVGSLHLDVVVRAPHLPGLDETVTGQAVDYAFGGKGGNQAVASARMGASVHFAGRAGSDSFGEILRAELAAAGVDCTQLQNDPGPSGMSTAIVTQSGDYGAVIVSAANLNMDADAISVPDGTAIVLLQNEVPEAVNLAVARKARVVGARVWLNAAPARDLAHDLLEIVDLVIVNRVEAEFYGDTLEDVPVLLTLGGEGVMFGGVQFPAPSVEVVSTHGAGDMFVGALAARVADGATMTQGIAFAQGAAALHVSSDLAARATLTAQAVRSFLAQR